MHFRRPKTRRGIITLWTAVAVAAAAIGGGFWYDRHWPWHHFRTVAAGRFYRAGQPSAADVRTAVRDYGVKTIINLRLLEERPQKGDWYDEEVGATAEQGATHVDVPLACSTPPSPAQIEQLLAIFDDPARLPVLV
ncbi:MAG TPA: tyrosine-protein phosphatase, partial [Planctomycetota bacterium]|nr:tyrosine-protein phosphatase [Planctomycetota bacterium]